MTVTKLENLGTKMGSVTIMICKMNQARSSKHRAICSVLYRNICQYLGLSHTHRFTGQPFLCNTECSADISIRWPSKKKIDPYGREENHVDGPDGGPQWGNESTGTTSGASQFGSTQETTAHLTDAQVMPAALYTSFY